MPPGRGGWAYISESVTVTVTVTVRVGRTVRR